MSSYLPHSWSVAQLSNVTTDVKSGFASGQKDTIDGLRHLRMNNIGTSGELILDVLRTVPLNLETSECLLSRGDIIVCTTNSAKLVGKCALFILEGKYAFSNHLTRLRPIEGSIIAVLLLWNLWLQWKSGYYQENCKHWVNQSTLPKEALLSTPVIIPPLNEQRRIVAKLEKLLKKVDSCQKRLAKIPGLLKRFRQSVLAAACSGRLTEDWRDRQDQQMSWSMIQLADLFLMCNGKSLPSIRQTPGEIPVFGGNGVSGMHDKFNVEGLVIVVGRVGANCGNVHYISGKVWVTDNAISLIAKVDLVPAFYAYFLRNQDLNRLSGGTGQPYVSQEILNPIQVPRLSQGEQCEIVRRVDELFSKADEIEARYNRVKEFIDKLKQSILAKAFRGELVPQDPNDEPAEALLERIRQERFKKASPEKPGRRKRRLISKKS